MTETLILLLIFGLILFWLYKNASSPNDERQSHYSYGEKSKAQSEVFIRENLQHLPQVWVNWVIDGDTVIISKTWQEIRIRLDSIDCPEDGQYWGDVAKYGLIKLIGGRKVCLEEHGLDSHGRILATIYVWNQNKNEWMNVNERMVILGHAWVMRKFYDHLPQDRQDRLNRMEGWAKAKKIGLWASLDPVPPWEWRKNFRRFDN